VAVTGVVVPIGQARQRRDPYNLDADFERQVVTLVCCRPRFLGRLRSALDPECFNLPASKLAVQACLAVARDLGHGPDSALVVIQRLRRWMGEGKVTQADIQDVADVFDAAEDAGLLAEDEVLGELTPLLRRRAEREAVETAVKAFQKRGDLGDAFDQMERARRIGTNDSSVGTIVGPESFGQLERLRQVQRLPTGILELDDVLAGGVMRGTESMFLGGPGDGKSMGLMQVACNAARMGFHVGIATLELPEPIQLARCKANLTGFCIDDILDAPDDPQFHKALADVQAVPGFGRIVVKEFSPLATTVEDLRDWVKDAEADWGFPMDVLVVDYADKLTVRSGLRKDDNGYTIGRLVYESLRVFASETSRWVWTASQATRGEGGKKQKKLDLGDTSDSMHKVRVADLVISLNARDDGTQMVFYVAKNRLGSSRKTVGPLPVEWERARIAPLNEYEAPAAPVKPTSEEAF